MKRNILFVALAAGLMFSATSCDDGKDEFLSDFSTIMYLRNSGELPVTVYKTGNDTEYNLIVNKAGSQLGAEASVDVEVMSDATLLAYNTENGVNYKALPKECYSIEGNKVTFGSSDLYKYVKVSLRPEVMENHIKDDATYVIPFEMVNGSDSINAEKKTAFIIPSISVPYIGFETEGFVQFDVRGNEGEETAEFNLVMPLPNKWELNAVVEVDEEALNDYNEANGKDYEMINADAYTMEVSPFEKDGTLAKITVKVDKVKLNMGMQALPLRIKSTSNENFKVDEARSVCVIGVNKMLPLIEMSENMVSSNATLQGDGTGLAGLFDGRGSGKHWHSYYQGEVINATYGHYIDFALPNPITKFAYIFWTRFENANGAPKVTKIYGSTDNQNWNLIGTVNNNLSGGDQEFHSDVFTSEEPISYIRFSVLQSNAGDVTNGSYWNCGEIQIMGE